jgi:hypothetical protein
MDEEQLGSHKRSPVSAIRNTIRSHPVLSWGSIAAIVTVLAAGASASLWIAEHFQSASDAHAHADKDAQRAAWTFYGMADLKAVILRNRVNECRAAPGTTALEVATCKQYEDEYGDAAQRARELYQQAMATGKERP